MSPHPIVTIEVETPTGVLEELSDRVATDLSTPLDQGRRAWIALGHGEFAAAAWRAPSGPARPWAALRSDGFRRPLGGPSSRLFQSYASGFVRRTENSIQFGSSLPYAALHRGGRGEVTVHDASRPARSRLTQKQRAFLAIRFREQNPGVPFGRELDDPDRGFLVTPRRPHFTKSPELSTRLTAIFAAWIGGREIPGSLVAAEGVA